MNIDGLTVKKYRQAKGITQSEAANALNVHRQTYAAYERHPCDMPIKLGLQLANYLGCTIDDIIFLDNESTKWRNRQVNENANQNNPESN